MHTKEYFSLLKKMDENAIQPEFHRYVTAWLMAKHPEIYLDVHNAFDHYEGEIYDQHQCNDANSEIPF